MSSPAPSSGWPAWLSHYASTLYHSGMPALFWVRPHWTDKQMTSQSGKVIVVTGGNSGTGYHTAKSYYEHGARVLILCRDASRAAKAIDDIKKGGENDIYSNMVYKPVQGNPTGTLDFVQCDLADLNSVEAAAKTILEKEKRVDVLFANAGIMATPEGQYTKQGYSLQFGTNVLGHQRLISLLLPLMQKTSEENPQSPSRLITLSSAAHTNAPKGGIDYESLQKGGKVLEKWAEYGESKWGDVALSKYVNLHYGPKSGAKGEIIAIAVHPGLVASNLYQYLSWVGTILHYAPWVRYIMYVTSRVGSLNQIWAAELPVKEAEQLSGGYVTCYETRGVERPDLNDKAAVNKLWEWCSAQVHRNE